jgi:hypothetical protein
VFVQEIDWFGQDTLIGVSYDARETYIARPVLLGLSLKLPPFQDRCEQKRKVTAHFVAALSGRATLLVENWAKAFVWFFIRRQENFHYSARPSTIVAKLTAFESSFKAKEKR